MRKPTESKQRSTVSPNSAASHIHKFKVIPIPPPHTTTAAKAASSRHQTRKSSSKHLSSPSHMAIWRDHSQLENVNAANGHWTAHKMSSVGNNFMSDDLFSDPLIFPQHTEVLRSSPLSISPEMELESETGGHEEDAGDVDDDDIVDEKINYRHANPSDEPAVMDFGMAWNPKENQWISLVYRYVFPNSPFEVPKDTKISGAKRLTWNINGHNSGSNHSNDNRNSGSNHFLNHHFSHHETYKFSFPPPQESIMMGSGAVNCGSLWKDQQISSEADAREACQKLLELIDDENLMLPVQASSSPAPPTATATSKSAVANVALRSLHSEWSSLPSSPPPPIFHDVCNRPIPELRLSPPMSSKTGLASAKKLFSSIGTGCMESPLTKRLRLSSSSSSIS